MSGLWTEAWLALLAALGARWPALVRAAPLALVLPMAGEVPGAALDRSPWTLALLRIVILVGLIPLPTELFTLLGAALVAGADDRLLQAVGLALALDLPRRPRAALAVVCPLVDARWGPGLGLLLACALEPRPALRLAALVAFARTSPSPWIGASAAALLALGGQSPAWGLALAALPVRPEGALALGAGLALAEAVDAPLSRRAAPPSPLGLLAWPLLPLLPPGPAVLAAASLGLGWMPLVRAPMPRERRLAEALLWAAAALVLGYISLRS